MSRGRMTTETAQKDTKKVSALLKENGIRLVPFFLAVIAYFASSAWKAKGEVWSTIVKCLPIWCLILFVVLTKGVKDLKSRSFFKVRLIFALIFSSLGDLFLNINMFEMGVVAFGIAQTFFISCLGFQPRRFFLGGIIYILWLGMNVFLMHYIPETLEIVFVFIYSGLLVTTCWRGIAACEKVRTVTEFPKLAGAIGGVSFLISDAVLGLSMFVIKESWMSIVVMITYYLAELGLTLICVDTRR